MGIKERVKKLEQISSTVEEPLYMELLTLPGGDGDIFRNFDNENAAMLQKKRYDKVLIGEVNNPSQHRAISRFYELVESEAGLYDCTGTIVLMEDIAGIPL